MCLLRFEHSYKWILTYYCGVQTQHSYNYLDYTLPEKVNEVEKYVTVHAQKSNIRMEFLNLVSY